MLDRLKLLKAGKKADIPIYSFAKHRRLDKTTSIYGANVLIIEGILSMCDPRVVELLDLRVGKQGFQIC